MKPAKVPRESSDWESLDIFVFSNGQQYSPPRKYHLRHEDLYFWDATLNLLARSQYGSQNSGINLFSLSGHMINSPLELSNNGTYVAVVPPDPFIPAGYENYLIKASKSWERRHSKKVIDDQIEKAGEITIRSGMSSAGVNKEIINIKTPDQEITIATVGKSKVDQDPERAEKPESANLQSNMVRGITGSIKPAEKRKSSNQPTPIETRTSILRKLTNTSNIAQLPSSSKRNSLYKTRDSKDTKGNLKLTPKTNGAPYTQVNLIDQTPTKLSKSLDTSTTTASTNLERVPPFTRLSNIPRCSKNETKETKTDDKDIILITNVYRSIDEMPSNFVDAANVLPNESKPKRRDSPQVHNMPILEESSDKNITPLIKDILVHSSTLVSVPQFTTPSINVEMRKSSKQNIVEPVRESIKTDDHFTAVLNKGEGVNLKLNIELNNGECTVKPVINTSPSKTRSLTDVKLEKTPNDKNSPDLYLSSKSFDSLVTTESNECYQKCQRVVVVKCPCDTRTSESSKGETKVKALDNDAKTYFIIVPIVTRSVKEWNKEPDVKTVSEKEVQNSPSLTKINRSLVSSEYLNRQIEYEGECCIHRGCCTQDRSEYVTIQRISTFHNNFMQSEYVFATQISELESQKVDYKPGSCMDIICIREYQDEETQTEWCSVLLEVRRHEDGHYTFHLPPLEVTKMFYLQS